MPKFIWLGDCCLNLDRLTLVTDCSTKEETALVVRFAPPKSFAVEDNLLLRGDPARTLLNYLRSIGDARVT